MSGSSSEVRDSPRAVSSSVRSRSLQHTSWVFQSIDPEAPTEFLHVLMQRIHFTPAQPVHSQISSSSPDSKAQPAGLSPTHLAASLKASSSVAISLGLSSLLDTFARAREPPRDSKRSGGRFPVPDDLTDSKDVTPPVGVQSPLDSKSSLHGAAAAASVSISISKEVTAGKAMPVSPGPLPMKRSSALTSSSMLATIEKTPSVLPLVGRTAPPSPPKPAVDGGRGRIGGAVPAPPPPQQSKGRESDGVGSGPVVADGSAFAHLRNGPPLHRPPLGNRLL